MAHIRNKETLEFTSRDEAMRYVRNLDGRVRFQVHVSCFLPTTEDRGFQGSTSISISRQQFLTVLNDVGSVLVDERGARIQLNVTPSNYEGGLSFVALT